MTDDDAPDLDARVLCPDGACIGVLGPDGRCKVCGAAAGAGAAPERPAPAARVRSAWLDPPGGDEDRLGLESRVLCPDGACVGVIGPDGRCRECGGSA